ncbi:hypothetical protein D3H65_17645 [Paraflavitalea soli]|uniref:Uncharacterized protein n=1 Tax=Paraflavitalea soli TaxID=2315862 RepID=A0A3B7MRM5_9BACT|nr:hypothetical protein [Paraflavitalea soli]AXY75690.1 hypothetical protein D3H65_17645 [Paraflavitalea soli]
MKEEQIAKASLLAGLITRTLCTSTTASESSTLHAWTLEEVENKLLVDELTDPDKLHEQLINFRKFKAVAGLEKINLRLFGSPQGCTAC